MFIVLIMFRVGEQTVFDTFADFQRSRSLPRKTSAPMLHSAPPTSHDDSSLPRRKSVGVYKNKV